MYLKGGEGDWGSAYSGSQKGLAELHTLFFLNNYKDSVPEKQFRNYYLHTLGVFLSGLFTWPVHMHHIHLPGKPSFSQSWQLGSWEGQMVCREDRL